MTNVTEHDSEEEGERNNRKQSRVDLLIFGDTITIHNGLEGFSELVRSHERGWSLVRPEFMENRGDTSP